MTILDLVLGGVLARLAKWLALSGLRPNVSRITDNIWVGGANHPGLIMSEGFEAVLDLRTEDHPGYRKSLEDHGIAYLNIGIPDRYGASPETLLKAANWIRDRVRMNQKTLVHCNLGRGRAALAVAAYLIRQGAKPEEAVMQIRGARWVTFLNGRQTESMQGFSDSLGSIVAQCLKPCGLKANGVSQVEN